MIPRLLDVVGKSNSQELMQQEFKSSSNETPAWVFLRWISQLVAVINRPESSIIDNKVKQIVKKYPHALYYPFKVVESNISVNMHDNEVQPTRLFNKI